MRKALIVGIDFYTDQSGLHGCVNDAKAVKAVLERHGDGGVNFGTATLIASDARSAISRGDLKDRVEELFKDDSEIALLYFAGHGYIEATGGYICASDAKRGDDGLSLGDVLAFANSSKAKNKVIVLDSCYSGIAGTPAGQSAAQLQEGLTILTASTKEQYASEHQNSGVFTSLFVDALGGAACNLVGDVTPGSVYAHIDQSLGPWRQRPVFKTNVKTFVSLRKVRPPIDLGDLRRLIEFFPRGDFEYRLDPTYEPEPTGRPLGAPGPILENTKKFAVLQKYNRVGLVVPVGASSMWHAAMERKACMLTALGAHYRRLVEDGLI